ARQLVMTQAMPLRRLSSIGEYPTVSAWRTAVFSKMDSSAVGVSRPRWSKSSTRVVTGMVKIIQLLLLVSVHGSGPVEHPLHLGGQQGVFLFLQQGVAGQDGGGLALGGMEGAGVGGQVRDLQSGQAMLAAAEKVAGATGLQIVLGHCKAVGGGAEEP